MSGDPYWNEVVLALHCDGADGSTTFTDLKGNSPTISSGTPQISTASSKFGGSSLYLPSASYLGYDAGSPDLDFGSDDFTFDFWLSTIRATPIIIECNGLFVNLNAGNLRAGIPGIADITGGAIQNQGWKHVALERYGSTFSMYIDGALSNSASVGTSAIDYSTPSPLYIAYSYGISSYQFRSYIDDIRITKGVARFKGAFSLPSAAFPDYYEAAATSVAFWN